MNKRMPACSRLLHWCSMSNLAQGCTRIFDHVLSQVLITVRGRGLEEYQLEEGKLFSEGALHFSYGVVIGDRNIHDECFIDRTKLDRSA
jgi:hypothetical protein